MKKEPLVFANFAELWAFLKGPKKFTEPLEENDEVQAESTNKRVAKPRTPKVGRSAKEKKKD